MAARSNSMKTQPETLLRSRRLWPCSGGAMVIKKAQCVLSLSRLRSNKTAPEALIWLLTPLGSQIQATLTKRTMRLTSIQRSSSSKPYLKVTQLNGRNLRLPPKSSILKPSKVTYRSACLQRVISALLMSTLMGLAVWLILLRTRLSLENSEHSKRLRLDPLAT